jgi:glycosyltransferase involved in cell wall biosynthesis
MTHSPSMLSLIATVKNEAHSIGPFLDSLLGQTRLPDEVVIVDGGSCDGTVERILAYRDRLGCPLRVEVYAGATIAQGRNRAIELAGGEIIACTDAGVRLAPDWLEKLVAPLERNPLLDVAAGFFVTDPHNLFELALGVTTIPDVDEINGARFLPSSRSVAFRRSAWRRAGGYPEWLDYCEDVVFDLALRRSGARFTFVPQAIVYYRPRRTVCAFFKQYYLYARGDGKAGLWPHRHAIRYLTYTLGSWLALHGRPRWAIWPLLLGLGLLYVRAPYVRLARRWGERHPAERALAVLLVPLLRYIGDVAKMTGYPAGLVWRIRRRLAGRGAGTLIRPGEDQSARGLARTR